MDRYIVLARSITTSRGIRGRGEIVRPHDFSGDGLARLVDLEARGMVKNAEAVAGTSAAPAPPVSVAPAPEVPPQGPGQAETAEDMVETAPAAPAATWGADEAPEADEAPAEDLGIAATRAMLKKAAKGRGGKKGPRGA